MTHEEAQARASERNRELPDGADRHWIAHHASGQDWRVVRMSARGMRFAGSADKRHETTEASPEREAPTDPRPLISRLIPPYGPS